MQQYKDKKYLVQIIASLVFSFEGDNVCYVKCHVSTIFLLVCLSFKKEIFNDDCTAFIQCFFLTLIVPWIRKCFRLMLNYLIKQQKAIFQTENKISPAQISLIPITSFEYSDDDNISLSVQQYKQENGRNSPLFQKTKL